MLDSQDANNVNNPNSKMDHEIERQIISVAHDLLGEDSSDFLLEWAADGEEFFNLLSDMMQSIKEDCLNEDKYLGLLIVHRLTEFMKAGVEKKIRSEIEPMDKNEGDY